MLELITFLAVFSLAGFTAFPYFCSKSGDAMMIPMHGTHRLFSIFQLLVVSLMVFVLGHEVNIYIYSFSVLAVVNHIVDFRHLFISIIKNEKYFFGLKGAVYGIRSDFWLASKIELDNEYDFDYNILINENNRLMTDLALFLVLINLISNYL